MNLWKIPPKAKVYEALSAVADGRVQLGESGKATVMSSDHTKTYDVEWTSDGGKMTSNDNGSYYQGYLGYPMLAVLMVTKRLSYDPGVAKALSGINWKAINTKFKNDFDKAVDHVLSTLPADVSRAGIEAEVDRIYQEIGKLTIARLPSARRPAK